MAFTRRLFVGSGAAAAVSYLLGFDRLAAAARKRRIVVDPGVLKGVGSLAITLTRSRFLEATGWPDATNTGYVNAPGYPGSLTNWPGGEVVANTNYSFYNFEGNGVSAMGIGDAVTHPQNISFYGCRFAATHPNDFNVVDYGDNTSYDYCTFEPYATSTTPVSFANSYQIGINKSFASALTVTHCNFWGFGNAIIDNNSTQAKPHVFRHNWFHDAADQANSVYHHDGILCTVGGANYRYVTIEHNTIVSGGNTNAIALQLDGGTYYDHITVINNRLGGFGYTVQIGGNAAGNSFITFTDNVLDLEIPWVFGPTYAWADGSNNLWRRNKWLDPAHVDARDGQYWWPTDTTGHVSDHTG